MTTFPDPIPRDQMSVQLAFAMHQLDKAASPVRLTRLQMLALLGARVSRPALMFGMAHRRTDDG